MCHRQPGSPGDAADLLSQHSVVIRGRMGSGSARAAAICGLPLACAPYARAIHNAKYLQLLITQSLIGAGRLAQHPDRGGSGVWWSAGPAHIGDLDITRLKLPCRPTCYSRFGPTQRHGLASRPARLPSPRYTERREPRSPVPTCFLAERPAQRQSGMPPRMRRDGRSRRAASLTERARGFSAPARPGAAATGTRDPGSRGDGRQP